MTKTIWGWGGCLKVYVATRGGVALRELLFPCSSNLFEFLGKRLPFRCVARAGGGRESKVTAKGREFPGWNLTRTLGAHNCHGYGGCGWLFFLAGGRMVGGG